MKTLHVRLTPIERPLFAKALLIAAASMLLLPTFGMAQSNTGSLDEHSLYLLSGTPLGYAGLPIALYRVSPGDSGPPVLVRKVIEDGVSVLADYDRRKLVVVSPVYKPTRFDVVDMEAPSKAAFSKIDYDTENLLPTAGMYLLNLPQTGAAIALALSRLWEKPFVYPKSLRVAALDQPGTSSQELPFENLKYIHVGGRVGGGLPDQDQSLEVRGNPLQLFVIGPLPSSTGLDRPPYLDQDPGGTRYWLAVDNDSTAVLCGGPHALDVLNRHTGQWRRIAMPIGATRVRAFGPWIAAILEEPAWLATQLHKEIISTKGEGEKIREFARKNAGADKRRTEIIGYKLTVDNFFDGRDATFPGELMVYNAQSGATFRISTGQADSEVVLVTDDAVFYRVNDQLYRAAIDGGQLAPAVVVASGDAVFQVHWAFLSLAKK